MQDYVRMASAVQIAIGQAYGLRLRGLTSQEAQRLIREAEAKRAAQVARERAKREFHARDRQQRIVALGLVIGSRVEYYNGRLFTVKSISPTHLLVFAERSGPHCPRNVRRVL